MKPIYKFLIYMAFFLSLIGLLYGLQALILLVFDEKLTPILVVWAAVAAIYTDKLAESCVKRVETRMAKKISQQDDRVDK